jgi:transcriptional regulator with XRE-family HTH domain
MGDVGRRVREARKARKVTQLELAARSGVVHSTVVRIERGQATPRIETVGRFAEALGVDPRWLAFGDGPERTEG